MPTDMQLPPFFSLSCSLLLPLSFPSSGAKRPRPHLEPNNTLSLSLSLFSPAPSLSFPRWARPRPHLEPNTRARAHARAHAEAMDGARRLYPEPSRRDRPPAASPGERRPFSRRSTRTDGSACTHARARGRVHTHDARTQHMRTYTHDAPALPTTYQVRKLRSNGVCENLRSTRAPEREGRRWVRGAGSSWGQSTTTTTTTPTATSSSSSSPVSASGRW